MVKVFAIVVMCFLPELTICKEFTPTQYDTMEECTSEANQRDIANRHREEIKNFVKDIPGNVDIRVMVECKYSINSI